MEDRLVHVQWLLLSLLEINLGIEVSTTAVVVVDTEVGFILTPGPEEQEALSQYSGISNGTLGVEYLPAYNLICVL